jgi:tetratricopeptide (TPR) repeat protein
MSGISHEIDTAIAHHRAGRLAEAEGIYRKILASDHRHAQALHFLGLIACQRHDFLAAVGFISEAVAIAPKDADAQSDLGTAHWGAGDVRKAVECYRLAASLSPDTAELHNHLGRALQELGELESAGICFRKALKLNPEFFEAEYNLANVLERQGERREAVQHYRRLLGLMPGHADAWNNLGNVLRKEGLLDEASACYRQALGVRPDFVLAHYNLGVVLVEDGRIDEALGCFEMAATVKTPFPETLNNAGLSLQQQARFVEAASYYQMALEVGPEFADARWNRSILLLLLGDFGSGWTEYEWRWKTGQLPVREFERPRWNGTRLDGKTVFVWAEQGLGDTIQFVRYAAMVKERGARVVFECQRPLVKLLQSCRGIDALVSEDDAPPAFDFQVPLLSVPAIFKTTLETIPAEVPYLFADEALIVEWRERLRETGGFRIGINWQGRGGHGAHRERDIPLEMFAELAELSNVRLISLQKGRAPEALDPARGVPIVDLGSFDDAHGPFMDTAAIMMNLDLVITSDTSVAHLAGALGIPVWVALPFVPDWRWLLERSDSPWYPTMRLFRQKKAGDWTGVFEEIEAALVERVG